MKILVVGAQSQVGQALVTTLREADNAEFDCLDGNEPLLQQAANLIARIHERGYDYVVNVDHFEGFMPVHHSQKEYEVSHLLVPQALAKACEKVSIPLLQLSDYQVFSGLSDKPYTEEDEPHARTMYGVTRWQGEVAIQRFTRRFIILRVGTLFGEYGVNCLTQLLTFWNQGKARELSTNIQFSPTPTMDVARVIYAILQQLDCGAEPWGLYHYCSADIATPYDFAEVALAARNQFAEDKMDIALSPVQTAHPERGESEKETKKKDAFNTVLVCEKLLNTFGVRQRPWRGELTRCIERLITGDKQQTVENK